LKDVYEFINSKILQPECAIGMHESQLEQLRHLYRLNTCAGRAGILGAEANLAGKGTIEEGSFAFPFQVVLPANLPGSMEWFQQGYRSSGIR